MVNIQQMSVKTTSKDAKPIRDRFPILIFAVALGIRLIYLWQSSDSPTFHVPIVDASTYELLAQKIINKTPLDSNLFWQPIFYPLFMVCVYSLFGISIVALKCTQAVVGACTCLLVYMLAKKLFDRRTGMTASLLTAVYPTLIFFEGELLGTGWAAFWSVALITVFLKAEEKPSLLNGVLIGYTSILALLTRPAFTLFLVPACCWLILRIKSKHSPKESILLLCIATLCASTLAFPYMLTNKKYTGHAKLLPHSGGINLYIGNNTNWVNTVMIRPGFDWSILTRMPRSEGITDAYESSAFFNTKVKTFAANDPATFLKGVGEKTIRFFNSRELPRNVDLYLFREWSTFLNLGIWKFKGFGFPFGLFLPLALVGLYLGRKSMPTYAWLFYVAYPASVILYFVTARYRVPLIPLLSIPAAVSMLTLGSCVRSRNIKTGMAISLPILTIALLSSMPGHFPEETSPFKSEMYREMGRRLRDLNQPAQSLQYIQHAVNLAPDYAEAHNDLAISYEQNKDYPRAIEHYKRTLELHPDSAWVYFNLGSCLSDSGAKEDVIPYLEKSLELFPDNEAALVNLGVAYQRVNQIDKAVEVYAKALKLNKDNIQVLNNLAIVHARSGDFRNAVTYFQRAVTVAPYDQEIRENLARAIQQLQQTR